VPGLDIDGSLQDVPSIEPLPVEEAFAVAQENRPDIKSLRWKVDAAKADIVVEDRKACPDVTPLIGFTRQYQKNTIGFPDASSYIVALTTSLPIYNRNQGNRAKAQALAAQSQYDLQTGVVALRAEIVQVTKEVETAAANARAVAGQQLQLARQVRDSLNAAYEVGGRPLIDVLNAQQDYQQTFQLYINTRASLGRATVRYWATLGKKITP
jgi:outer membrane protein, heavy metal efflux system